MIHPEEDPQPDPATIIVVVGKRDDTNAKNVGEETNFSLFY